MSSKAGILSVVAAVTAAGWLTFTGVNAGARGLTPSSAAALSDRPALAETGAVEDAALECSESTELGPSSLVCCKSSQGCQAFPGTQCPGGSVPTGCPCPPFTPSD